MNCYICERDYYQYQSERSSDISSTYLPPIQYYTVFILASPKTDLPQTTLPVSHQRIFAAACSHIPHYEVFLLMVSESLATSFLPLLIYHHPGNTWLRAILLSYLSVPCITHERLTNIDKSSKFGY